jgi:hypothetical protein
MSWRHPRKVVLNRPIISFKKVSPSDTFTVGQRDKVPKWSKAAFQDKFNIMKGKLENGEEVAGSKKYTDLDSSLARLQRKLKEGSALEIGQRGSNRVSALAGELFDSSRCQCHKTFSLLQMARPNKLECLSFETLSRQDLKFEGKARANPIRAHFRCFLLG